MMKRKTGITFAFIEFGENRHLSNNYTIKCKITTVIEPQREELGAMRANNRKI